MHNLHFIRVKADTPEEACNIAENSIDFWGDENNWRFIGGCVSEHNEVYIHDSFSRWVPDVETTIEKINDMCSDRLTVPDYYKNPFDRCVQGLEESPFDWYSAKKYCEHMYEVSKLGVKTFDVLQDEFYSWKLDEFGVTDVGHKQDGDTTYVVFIDMHD